VAGSFYHIGVVAEPAPHGVGAGAAIKDVGGIVAGEIVGEIVAGAVDRVDASQDQILEVRAQGERNRALHLVGAAARHFGDAVPDIVDDVGVVAQPAAHRVGAGLAVENVVAVVAL